MSDADDRPQGPRTFLSYSWSSPEHEDWVLRLAGDLVDLDVDVVLDKWDLQDGDDPFPFMERIVTDPDLKKVVLICDREYVRKADAREGGVGAEAQILTPELYRAAQADPEAPGHEKAETRKFVAVVREPAPPWERSAPAFYGGRIHIDMADDEGYGDALTRLSRWIYDKPLHVRPPRGKAPAFVTDGDAPSTSTSVRQRHAIKALREGRREADGAVDDYFETLAGNLPRFDLDPEDDRPTQAAVVERADQLRPVRDEVLDVVKALVRYRPEPEGWEPVHLFFQRCLPLLDPLVLNSRVNTWSRDHFRLVVPELFLYALAALLQRRRYENAAYMLSEPFTLPESGRGSGLVPFTYLQQGSEALQRHYQDQNERWISYQGTWIHGRADSTGVPFDAVMQADLVLALRAEESDFGYWWPSTLVYKERRPGPFDVFARSASAEHFERLMPVLGVSSAEELRQRADGMGRDGWIHDHHVHVPGLIGSEHLASQP
ncbi:SEFIR domain-containing protein [Rubricoccus marinus]|uniref:SEFIR domain-containing protein n=1 Tax=Rubricoccus marinus TaxID=716817 RepID=A0A259TUT2_9BACT|nr:SEFIR domain-containing protein [Rubricoccus marinus]OZC01460.1 hypothetical protein BSZ36_17440 [Rubricoccus marinus]